MRRLFPTSAVLLTLLYGALSCGTSDPPVRRYHARGLVTQITGAGEELLIGIHHERIAAFEDRDGKRSNMASMTMAFGVAPDVPRDLWSQGAKVDFDFEVRWSKQPTLYIVKAAPLPADTALQLTQEH